MVILEKKLWLLPSPPLPLLHGSLLPSSAFTVSASQRQKRKLRRIWLPVSCKTVHNSLSLSLSSLSLLSYASKFPLFHASVFFPVLTNLSSSSFLFDFIPFSSSGLVLFPENSGFQPLCADFTFNVYV
jgi:hypothetical protein